MEFVLLETPESYVTLSTMWGHNEKSSVCEPEESSHQSLTMLTPYSWTFSIQNCEKYIFRSHSVYGISLQEPSRTDTHKICLNPWIDNGAKKRINELISYFQKVFGDKFIIVGNGK